DFTARRIPQARRSILAGRGEKAAVGTKSDRIDVALVGHAKDFASIWHTPHTCTVVARADREKATLRGGEKPAVGAECKGLDRLVVPQSYDFAPAIDIRQQRRTVCTCACQMLSVRTERDGPDIMLMRQAEDFTPVRQFPQMRIVVALCGC